MDRSQPAGRGPAGGHRLAGVRLRVPLAIALVQTIGMTIAARNQPEQLDPLGYLLLTFSALALATRYRYPVVTYAVVGSGTGAYQLLDYPGGPSFVALIVAGIVAVKAGRRYPVWALTFAGYAAWVGIERPSLPRAAVLAAWVFGLLLVAEWARGAAAHRARAILVQQERARVHEEQQRRQASEQRLRIAQELHDVLGHHLSLINVQAGVGLHLMDSQPAQARAALGAIKQASAEALREVRSVLAALHPEDELPPLTPAPRLAQLVDLTTDAGLAVHTSVVGRECQLPAQVDRTAYRIVQEALTNVRRHAGAGASATVVIEYREAELLVRVDDDGGAAGPITGPVREGGGIGGMRERAAALGGWLRATPRPGGGFRVETALPATCPGGGYVVIRVLLADDQALVRAGFRALLDAEPDIEVVGEASDGAHAVRLATQTRPDLVLMDIRMPGLDGLAATRQIAADAALAGTRIVILTTFELDEYVFEALRAGAAGFLVKDTEPVELVRGVRAVAAGDGPLSPGVTRRVIERFAAGMGSPAPRRDLAELTDREREVTALVGAGLSNDEIARRLVVSPATAKTHVSRSMVKLGARDRAQLVVFAYEAGLVRPGWLP